MSYHIYTEMFGPYQNFIHILVDDSTKKAIVFDPAWDAQHIANRLNDLGVTLDAIWLTHGHHDHTNALNDLRKIYPVPVYASKTEIDFIKNVPEAIESKVFLPLPDDINAFSDGDTLTIGETSVKIIATPGHSAGSVCFLLKNDLITGDSIFIDGCGRTDLPGSDTAALFESLTKIVKTVPRHVMLHTGHAYGPTETATLESQIQTNPYLKQANQNEFSDYRMTH